jgi:hypothetical protein
VPDLALHLEVFDALAKLSQLVALAAAQHLRRALPVLLTRALHPLTQRGLGQIQVLGHLGDAPVSGPTKTHRLRLELRGE